MCAWLPAGSAAAPVRAPQVTPTALSVPAGHALVWSDEFSADGLPDTSKWAYDTGMNKQGWHNRELQYYSGPRAESAEVRDGRLVITARKEQRPAAPDWGGQGYTSSRPFTKGKAEWTYGCFVPYERPRPEQTMLFRLMQQHATNLIEQAEAAAGTDLLQSVKAKPGHKKSGGLFVLGEEPAGLDACDATLV